MPCSHDPEPTTRKTGPRPFRRRIRAKGKTAAEATTPAIKCSASAATPCYPAAGRAAQPGRHPTGVRRNLPPILPKPWHKSSGKILRRQLKELARQEETDAQTAAIRARLY
ncbi:hypothetical protein BU26DRAFT_322549 [Trematosphaeria pertusa]|uniref:Uncharacterized protein n=1 Tax=Trematosphaeria pertusa TaxID=390896 RepID=A0A6A6ICF7_9PLEO|nr:uncharacterized protein BU26DRAFT_322549 [Trematosphaeria pertusa]KAF2247887.1 hypothetical protein BU26DRAFT_322549 [Trematosphaeria pertusa]